MATLKIQKVDLKKTFDWGSVYTVIGELDGELATLEIAGKNAPVIGETVEGMVEETPYGKKFKKSSSGGRGFTPRQEDPEKQASIIRQSSFERAVMIQSKIADILIAEKKYDEAHETMKFKTITDLSNFIAKYAEGKLKVEVTTSADDVDVHELPWEEQE